MAIETGINDKNNYSGESDWEYYQRPENRKFLELFLDKLGSKHYTIYKTGKNIISYFLTKDDKYLGVIQVEEFPNKQARILTSHSYEKGFYQIMFQMLLTKYNSILSDVSLSTQAIKSYKKLSKSQMFKIGVLDVDNQIHKFSKSKLLEYPGNRVIILPKQEKFLKEHLDEYYKRISQSENNRPSTFKQMFESNDNNLDLFLFGPGIN